MSLTVADARLRQGSRVLLVSLKTRIRQALWKMIGLKFSLHWPSMGVLVSRRFTYMNSLIVPSQGSRQGYHALHLCPLSKVRAPLLVAASILLLAK